MAQWQSGGLQTQSMLVCAQAVFFGFLRPWRTIVNLRRLEFFTSYLRNGQNGNLRVRGHRELHLWPTLYRT
jgi:hypothetical protein